MRSVLVLMEYDERVLFPPSDDNTRCQPSSAAEIAEEITRHLDASAHFRGRVSLRIASDVAFKAAPGNGDDRAAFEACTRAFGRPHNLDPLAMYPGYAWYVAGKTIRRAVSPRDHTRGDWTIGEIETDAADVARYAEGA